MPDKGRKVDKVDKGGGSSGAHCPLVGGLERSHQVDASDQVELSPLSLSLIQGHSFTPHLT